MGASRRHRFAIAALLALLGPLTLSACENPEEAYSSGDSGDSGDEGDSGSD
jgi:hypothetical protein